MTSSSPFTLYFQKYCCDAVPEQIEQEDVNMAIRMFVVTVEQEKEMGLPPKEEWKKITNGVYRAGSFAVKCFQNGLALKREVSILARLCPPHINVIRIEWARARHLVFDLYEGSLTKFPFDERRMDVMDVVAQIENGLDAIHDCHVIHRDLKPDNILFKGSVLVIADFDLAVHEKGQLKNPHVQTAGYRAPELCFGKNIYSYEIDWWSLGAIVCHLIAPDAMRYPYNEDTSTKIIQYTVKMFGYPTDKDYIYPIWSSFKSEGLAYDILQNENTLSDEFKKKIIKWLQLNPFLRR